MKGASFIIQAKWKEQVNNSTEHSQISNNNNECKQIQNKAGLEPPYCASQRKLCTRQEGTTIGDGTENDRSQQMTDFHVIDE